MSDLKLADRERILDLVRSGNYPPVAAAACGIHPSELEAWLRRGRRYDQADVADRDPEDERYSDFARSLLAAEAGSEADAVEVVRGSEKGEWRASAWFLERRFEDRWWRSKELAGDSLTPNTGGVLVAPGTAASTDEWERSAATAQDQLEEG